VPADPASASGPPPAPASGSPGAGELPLETFKKILDLGAHPLVVIDRTGEVLYAGGTVQDVLGWTAEQLLGRNMIEFLTPDGAQLAVQVVSEIDEEDRTGAGVPMVFEVLRADGTAAWVEVGALPLLDDPAVDGIALRFRPWDSQHSLDRFVAQLLADEPLADVLASLSRAIAAALEAPAAVIHHGFDGEGFAAAVGSDVPDACLVSDGPWRHTAATGEPCELAVDDLPDHIAAAARAAGFRACWTGGVPARDGLAPAVVTVWRAVQGRPLAGHRQVFERARRYVQLALIRTAEHQRLRHLAGHDSLTGVANRAQFRDRLAEALAIGERDLAVAFCDLDGFKAVNDTYGHERGDAVLISVADRLRASLRVGDELARMGGDEFTVLLRNVADAPDAHHVADRLLGALHDPFVVDGEQVTLGLSIGIALAGSGATADSLLRRADEALYSVKRGGGSGALVVTTPS